MFELSGMGLIYAVHREQEAGSEVREWLVHEQDRLRSINKESDALYKR